MRTALIAAAALAVVASTASAANFDINAADATLDDISSGTSDVDDCTNGLQTDLVPAAYVPGVNDWDLGAVAVVAAPTDGDATTLGERCEGFVVTVVVESNIDDLRVEDAVANAASFELTPITVAADATTLTFPAPALGSGDEIRISEIDEVSILVDRPDTFGLD